MWVACIIEKKIPLCIAFTVDKSVCAEYRAMKCPDYNI
jgi:hypothetical protein